MRERGSKASPIKKILVPTDFSPASEAAIDYAAMMASRFKAALVLLHVTEPFPYSTTDSLVVVDHSRALQAVARSLLAGLRKGLEAKGFTVRAHMAVGSPYREILRRAEQDRVQLIVMGTHGRTGVGHLLMGSVAERVVRLAHCAVLTVRDPSRRQSEKKPSKYASVW